MRNAVFLQLDSQFLNFEVLGNQGNGCTDGSKTHYNDVIMSEIASQITSLTIVYLTVYSGAD